MRSFITFLLSVFVLQSAVAMKSKDLLKDPAIDAITKKSISSLIEKNQIQMESEWAVAAEETLKNSTSLSEAKVLSIRESSELTVSEVQNALRLEENVIFDEKARRPRPARPREGALYQDVYQESPVLIDYRGEGNVVQEMSFAVVYKYLRDDDGVIRPHFVRAQLVSPGTAGHRTSIGEFNIDRRHRYYTSQTYGGRMDYAQFFIGGIAIHQTLEENYRKLGMPASHGCVRHHELDADAMWNLMGEALEDGYDVNIKVYPFGVNVILADGSSGTERVGFGEQLNDWLNKNIECTRRGVKESCSKNWNLW